jgi:hypothetical protein
MKSIKQQYIDLREGNMSQANFMRNIRMTLPHLVTNVTSYEDSVRILKNKGILTEADIAIPKDTLNKVKKVIGDITANNDDYHRDGYVMGFFEGKDIEEESINELTFPLMDQWLEDIKDIIEDRWQNGQIATPAEYGSVMTKLNKPSDVIAKYGKMDAEDAANELLNSVSHLGNEYDPGPGEDENFERDYDADYEEPNEPFDMAESLNEAKDNSSEGKWKTVNGKDLYAHFKELDNLNGHEVAQGIDWEMQCNPELPKKDIIKKVIKNLKKNPIYYTSWDLSGKEGYEPETMGPKADIAARQMQYLDKNMGNVVDKKMGMKPVKDVEKVKKDADAKKETNTPEKGISLMSLIAKSVRGLKKMDATGEKMKKIAMKEARLNDFPGEKPGAIAQQIMNFIESNPTLKQHSDEITLQSDPDGFLKYGYWETLPSDVARALSLQFDIKSDSDYDEDTGTLNFYRLTPKHKMGSTDLGGSFDKLKDQLKEMIRKQLKEMADGMEPMSREAGIKSSNIELIGPDVDELLDAINFINKGIGKGNQKVQLPFGNNTLKALDDDGQSMGGGKFSIGVQPKTANESLYVRQVNDFLDDHGFTCKLYVTK